MDKIGRYSKTVLVSQGTFEPDHTKLIIPTLDAPINAVSSYKESVARLRDEFRTHPAAELSAKQILDLLA